MATKNTNTAQKAETTNKEPVFTKAQFLNSKKYLERRDALSAILDENREYTHSEVEALLDGFMKGKVK